MDSFATLVEIDITNTDIKLSFFPRGALWIAAINEENAEFNNSFFETVYKIKINNLIKSGTVGSLTVDTDKSYTQVYSFEAAYKQNKSFYIFEEESIKYIAIHFNNFETPFSKEMIFLNIKSIFSNREWLEENGDVLSCVNGLYIEPRIYEIESADIEADALNFETVQTNEMSVTLLNHDGLFDNFDNLYGNRFLVKKIKDGEGLKKAEIIFLGFVQKPEFSYLDTVAITASDIRYGFSTELPKRVFDLRKYNYLDKFPKNTTEGRDKNDTIDTQRTLAAGRGVTVKLTPIKYETRDGYLPEIVFEICDTTENKIERICEAVDTTDGNKKKPAVYFIEKAQNESIEKDGVTITGDIKTFLNEYRDYGKGLEKVWTLDKEKGTLTFRGDNQVRGLSIESTDELVELYAEIDIPPYKSLTFLREIIESYEGIAFIKENFDTENWIKEEELSKEIAIKLDSDNTKTVLDILGEICFLEQGRVEIVDGKITFISTKNREIKYKFNQNKMGRVDKTVDSDEYLSTVSILYNLGEETYKNTDFEKEAKRRHRLDSHEEFETILKNKEDAIKLSNKIMEARYILKDYYTFEYLETLKNLKLFDLVEFSYKRENGKYFIEPAICEIVKLNIFDNIVKLRKIKSL